MMLVFIDERLTAISTLINKGKRVADIGTDHAYLPVFLIQNDIAVSVIAADINNGPLGSAAKTLDKYNCHDKISLRLSDGLDSISADECDEIVIAGMGGELIASIIEKADWIKSEKYHLVLQPMSMNDFLRRFLYKNGFEINNEIAVSSQGKFYTVMSVSYTGISRDIDELYAYIGKLKDKNDQSAIGYKKMMYRRILKQANGLMQQRAEQNADSATAKELFLLLNEIENSMVNTFEV